MGESSCTIYFAYAKELTEYISTRLPECTRRALIFRPSLRSWVGHKTAGFGYLIDANGQHCYWFASDFGVKAWRYLLQKSKPAVATRARERSIVGSQPLLRIECIMRPARQALMPLGASHAPKCYELLHDWCMMRLIVRPATWSEQNALIKPVLRLRASPAAQFHV